MARIPVGNMVSGHVSVELPAEKTFAGRIWVSHPNHSLSVSGAQLLFFIAAVVASVIALAFTLLGAWPVIPFTGIELAILLWALRRCEKHADDFERITLEAGRLTVETRKGALIERHEFHPYWAQVQYIRTADQQDQRLQIRSHGKAVEIGILLAEEQKTALAKELKQALSAR